MLRNLTQIFSQAIPRALRQATHRLYRTSVNASALRMGFEKLGLVKTALDNAEAQIKLHHYKIGKFKPNVSFAFERGKFLVKTAENGTELTACLRLRFEVFHREYQGKTQSTGLDIDGLDFICDHLIIFEKATGKVIGTYRMNSSRYSDTFYAATEFSIDEVLALPGHKLELGRACIDKDYRTGSVISLLWRGIFKYAAATESKIFFGCTSVKTTDTLEIGKVTKYIRENAPIEEGAHVVPLPKFRVAGLQKALAYIEANPFEYREAEILPMIPALFASYISLGARIAPEPALDRDFGCIDFLTIMHYDQINSVLKGKMQG